MTIDVEEARGEESAENQSDVTGETQEPDVKEEELDDAAFEELLAENEDQDENFELESVEEVEEKKKKKKKKNHIKKDVEAELDDASVFNADRVSITGDFAKSKTTLSMVSSMSDLVEEEEEEVEEEEEKVVMSQEERNKYYEIYDALSKDYNMEKQRNTSLTNRLIEYFQEKRMLYLLHQGKVPLDSVKKYEKLLDAYDALTQVSENEQLLITSQIKELTDKCLEKENEVLTIFQTFQNIEAEAAKDIVGTESGQKYEEKFKRYLKNQKSPLELLSKIRLHYIKIRNKLTDTQNALKALDNVGSQIRLMDFEQLKYDNRNLKDKLEDKEMELKLTRTKCQNTVQTLAHVREKVAALNQDLHELSERLEGVRGEFEDVREQLNQLKMERDQYRKDIEKMKKESGLLTKPRLLNDMSEINEEGKVLSEEVEELIEGFREVLRKISKLRKNMSSESKMAKIKQRMEAKGERDQKSWFTGSSLSDEHFAKRFSAVRVGSK